MPIEVDLRDGHVDDAVCPYPARYLHLPSLITKFFQDYFAQTDGRFFPASKDWKFVGNVMDDVRDFQDAIIIRRIEDDLGDAHTNFRRILTRRGPVAIRRDGIGNGLRQGFGQHGNDPQYAVTYFGTIQSFCMSKHVGEADLLGAEAEQLLSHFCEKLRKQWSMRTFRVSQVGEPGRVKEFPGFFAVPVVLDYIYEDNVTITSGTFPLRNIVLDIK